jgi:hypothetical protein
MGCLNNQMFETAFMDEGCLESGVGTTKKLLNQKKVHYTTFQSEHRLDKFLNRKIWSLSHFEIKSFSMIWNLAVLTVNWDGACWRALVIHLSMLDNEITDSFQTWVNRDFNIRFHLDLVWEKCVKLLLLTGELQWDQRAQALRICIFHSLKMPRGTLGLW